MPSDDTALFIQFDITRSLLTKTRLDRNSMKTFTEYTARIENSTELIPILHCLRLTFALNPIGRIFHPIKFRRKSNIEHKCHSSSRICLNEKLGRIDKFYYSLASQHLLHNLSFSSTINLHIFHFGSISFSSSELRIVRAMRK